MYKGFVRLHRELLGDIDRGDLSLGMFFIYCIMLLQADQDTGIWWGSARKLWLLGPRDRSIRSIQDNLHKLGNSGYLKSFHVRGRHGNFPVLINRFDCTDGAQKRKHLNAANSTDCTNLVYESCGTGRTEVAMRLPLSLPGDCADDNIEAARTEGLIRTSRESRKKNEPLSAHSALKAFTATAVSTFKQRIGFKPSWGEKDFVQLASLMRRHLELPESEFEVRWDRYLTDTDAFVIEQGYSLALFCSKFDSYIKHPPLVRGLSESRLS